MASRMIALRTVARSQTLWARPVSTSAVRPADKDEKSMYDKVKDKAGGCRAYFLVGWVGSGSRHAGVAIVPAAGW